MTTTQRGLDLSRPDETTPEEIEGFRQAYASVMGRTHDGLNFWLEHDPSFLKRYRRYAETMVPNYEEEPHSVGITAYLATYAMSGFVEGVRYLITINQSRGFSKQQNLEAIALAFLHIGPRGMETIAKALKDFEWVEQPVKPVTFPTGWAPDPAAFASGLDFSTMEMLPGEEELLRGWYERTLGEVPGYASLLLKHRPELLKAYRARYENLLRVLPKQFMATSLLCLHVTRRDPHGIREAMLLARAFGVDKGSLLKMLSYGTLYGGIEALSTVEAAAGDVLDAWSEPS